MPPIQVKSDVPSPSPSYSLPLIPFLLTFTPPPLSLPLSRFPSHSHFLLPSLFLSLPFSLSFPFHPSLSPIFPISFPTLLPLLSQFFPTPSHGSPISSPLSPISLPLYFLLILSLLLSNSIFLPPSLSIPPFLSFLLPILHFPLLLSPQYELSV